MSDYLVTYIPTLNPDCRMRWLARTPSRDTSTELKVLYAVVVEIEKEIRFI
jgi:hypothetical protein